MGEAISLGDRVVMTLPRRDPTEPSIHQLALDEAGVTHLAVERYLRGLAKRLAPEDLVEFMLRKCYPPTPGKAKVFYPPHPDHTSAPLPARAQGGDPSASEGEATQDEDLRPNVPPGTGTAGPQGLQASGTESRGTPGPAGSGNAPSINPERPDSYSDTRAAVGPESRAPQGPLRPKMKRHNSDPRPPRPSGVFVPFVDTMASARSGR